MNLWQPVHAYRNNSNYKEFPSIEKLLVENCIEVVSIPSLRAELLFLLQNMWRTVLLLPMTILAKELSFGNGLYCPMKAKLNFSAEAKLFMFGGIQGLPMIPRTPSLPSSMQQAASWCGAVLLSMVQRNSTSLMEKWMVPCTGRYWSRSYFRVQENSIAGASGSFSKIMIPNIRRN